MAGKTKTVKPVKRRPKKVAPKTRQTARCVVCGSEVAPFSSESLCWVCRRLKISAWRENDSQAAMPE